MEKNPKNLGMSRIENKRQNSVTLLVLRKIYLDVPQRSVLASLLFDIHLNRLLIFLKDAIYAILLMTPQHLFVTKL